MFRALALLLLVTGSCLITAPAWAIPKNIKAVLPEPSHATSTSSSQVPRTYWSPGRHRGWHPRWRHFR